LSHPVYVLKLSMFYSSLLIDSACATIVRFRKFITYLLNYVRQT